MSLLKHGVRFETRRKAVSLYKTTKLFSVRLVKREGMGYIRGDEFYDI